MGGTFDPIHIGHLTAAAEALQAFSLDRVLFVPAGEPWQRSDYSPPEDRYLMTTLGVADRLEFAVSRVELDRPGPTYTADTLDELVTFFDDVELFLILGSDAAANLGTWEGLDRIARAAEVIVIPRPGSDLEGSEPEASWPRLHHCSVPGPDVSSSAIRARVRKKAPIDDVVPARVAAHIHDRGLYLESLEQRDV